MVHEYGDELEFLFGYRRTLRTIAGLSVTVICCSRAVEQRLLDVFPGMRTRVIYYGMDVPCLNPRPRAEPVLRAVLLGRFAESKGQEFAVRALAIARARGADIHLTIAGPGGGDASEKVAMLARRLKVDDHLTLIPEGVDPLEMWRQADVALMCSIGEGFGRVTVEAMKAGLPVCGVLSGGTSEIVVHETNGLLSLPDDDASFAAGLVRLAGDEALRFSLARGAARSAAQFSMTRYGAELLALLRPAFG
jgi:glycosyltransferase involved in cell wall biosynthesis